MLVLARKMGESIVVPSVGLTIHVVSIKRGQVRLAITAPPAVKVHRHEVWERIGQAKTVFVPDQELCPLEAG